MRSKRQSPCQGGSQSTVDGDVFTVICGVDYPGNDLIRYAEVSMANCLQTCSSYHPLCVGVAFEASLAHGPDNCYLKSSIGPAVTQTFSIDGAYSVPTAASELCSSEKSPSVYSSGLEFALNCGYDYPGNDLIQYHTSSLDACIESCVGYGAGCVAVAYEASLQHGFENCYLKNALGTATKQSFVVDGAVLIGTPTSTTFVTNTITSGSTYSSASSISTASSTSSTSSSSSISATPAISSNLTKSTEPLSSNKGMKIGLGVGVSVGVLLISLLIAFLVRRARTPRTENDDQVPTWARQELPTTTSQAFEKFIGRGELENPSSQIHELPVPYYGT